ncbi:MAG: GFA family protein [Rhizobiaceae bacterium]|nr:GFA family protein [Rhizobiaceae bacterium]
MTLPHTGGCRCGAVRFEASAEPHHVSYCHCADCRHASGAPVSAFVGFRTDTLVFSGTEPKAYTNGPVTRTFCAACGSPIAYIDERLAGESWILLGAMDAPEEFKPTLHAYVREQLPYVHMPDALPRHVGSSVPRPDGTEE